MTNIDDILITANTIANEGKKPTVALVKAKLSQPFPLPTIISVLKNWQHDKNFISHHQENNVEVTVNNESNTNENLVLEQQFALLKKDIVTSFSSQIDELKQEIAEIKVLLKNRI